MTARTDPIDSFHHEAGKGHIQRPSNHEKYSKNYDLIFGSKTRGENHATEKRLFSQDDRTKYQD